MPGSERYSVRLPKSRRKAHPQADEVQLPASSQAPRASATSGQARGQICWPRPRRGKHAGRMPGLGHVGASTRADLLASATSGQARGQICWPRPRRGKHAGRSVGLGHVGASTRADLSVSATSGQARGQICWPRPRRGKHAGRMPGLGHVGASTRADLSVSATSGQARGQPAGTSDGKLDTAAGHSSLSVESCEPTDRQICSDYASQKEAV